MTTKDLTPEQLLSRLNIVVRNQSIAAVLPALMTLLQSIADIAASHPATNTYMQQRLALALARLRHDSTPKQET